MVPPNPLKQLHDLNRTLPQFHRQLSNFLHGDEYRNAIPNLQGEDLMWLVEYLDSVNSQTISPHSKLNNYLGSRRYSRLRKPRISGILA